MKIFKTLLLIGVLIAAASTATAQTMAYKQLFVVNPATGVRENPPSKKAITYYTFTNNKQYVYFSDANGIKKGYSYQYKGTKNGMHYYEVTEMCFLTAWIMFSSDFKRINEDWLDGKVLVKEYVADPSTSNAPSQMY